jgi:competence protein ComEC
MINSLNKIPLIRFLSFFIAGILMAIYNPFYTFYSLPLFIGVFFIYIILLFIKRINSNYQYRWVFGLFIYSCFFLAGSSITSQKIEHSKNAINPLKAKNNQFVIAELSEPPQIKERTTKVILNIKGVRNNKDWNSSSGKVIIYLQNDSLSKLINLGDIISFEPKLENVPPPKNPNEFDYRNYLSYHLIYQQAFLRSNNWRIVEKANTNNLFKIAEDIRAYLIQSLAKKDLNKKELAVASALILGYKDDIDAQLKSAYSSAGAMHVLAVSGLHVGIIFLIFSFLLKFLEKIKNGKIIKGVLLIIILWCYALLTGLSPSVMRAATMFSFIVVAKMLDRNSNFFNTLAASALTLLIINPMLIMEVGFQLSYLAVIGIVIIQPWVFSWWQPKWWVANKIWEISAVSIAAQIATFPLGLLYFHQFPNYFLLSNLIVIPMAIIILYLGIITLSLISIPIVGDYLAIALKYTIKFLNWSVIQIDQLPYSLTQNIRFSVIDTWLVYLTIIGLILLIAYRKSYYFFISATCTIIFLISISWRNFEDLKQRQLIIYNIPQNTTLNFIDGRDNILVSNIKLTQNRSKMLFHVQNNWINKGVNNEKVIPLSHLDKTHQLSNIFRVDNSHLFTKQNYFQFYDYKIAVIDNKFIINNVQKKLIIDLLVISKNIPYSITELLQVFDVKEIIIDASNSKYVSSKLKEEAIKLNVNCFDVSTDGAFIKTIR